MTFGMIGGPPTLDPYSPVATDLTRALVRPIYPSLFRLLPDGEIAADLGAEVDASGRTARVSLVDREWSNGDPITARDVIASVRRAVPPSGFARLTARATGRHEVVFRGRTGDWEQTLATSTFVLPGGRFHPYRAASGPFELGRYVPGLKLALTRSSTWEGSEPNLDRITVFFIENLDIAVELLQRRRLDAAALPSSVNLDERVEEMGLNHAEARGWESVRVQFNPDTLTQKQWIGASREIDVDALRSGFVRDDGRVINTLHPGPDHWDGAYSHLSVPAKEAPDELRLAAPAGDQLLELFQRAIQIQLGRAGIDMEVAAVPADKLYGVWRSSGPFDAALLRLAGAPGLRDPHRLASRWFARPLVQVETMLAWTDDVTGLVVNPTLEGPLWNAERWFRNSGQI
ncbi:MAG: ABC transporter substrate-binding protein [Actinomycetota bacterium]